jgi:hypothetical protein
LDECLELHNNSSIFFSYIFYTTHIYLKSAIFFELTIYVRVCVRACAWLYVHT